MINCRLVLVGCLMLAIMLAGCSADTEKTVVLEESVQTIQYVSSMLEDQGSAKIIGELAREYGAAHPDVRYEFENVNTADLLQKIQLMAASNDLPEMFSFESGKPLELLAGHGFVLDLEKAFKELGLYGLLNPTAVKLLKSMVGGKGLYALPLEMNLEGFWYNKKIFREHGLYEPRTWDELLRSAETLHARGIQPFATAGSLKWPITRLINGYVVREYGYDAMQRVSRGELSVKDPGFIEAARIVQELGLKGYLGEEANTVDLNGAASLFLQGKAAIYYSGSWSLRDFNDPARNHIGTDEIGFFNVPLVEGGKGSLDDWMLNAGLTTSFSAAAYDDKMKDWMKHVFGEYGNKAPSELGFLTGFQVEEYTAALPPLTRMVQRKMNEVKNGVLWFEALFAPEAQTVAWNNAQLLISNERYTPEMYMADLQAALESRR